MRFLATGRVLGPFLRQIKPIRDRQAGMMIGDRQCHCYLTIGLFAKLPAILMVHANRVGAVLWKRRVVDNPGLDRSVPLDRRHDHLTHFGLPWLSTPLPVG